MIVVDLLIWLIFGLIVGGIARFLVPGRDPMGCVGTIAIGVLGSLLGGLLLWALFAEPGQPYSPSGFIGAILGGIIVVVLYRRLAPEQI